MRTKLETCVLALAAAGLLALPAVPRTAAAEEDSTGSSVTEAVKDAGKTTKDAAVKAGSATKDAAKGAAGYATDTAKEAGARMAGKDSLFVRKAAIGGLAEVKSAELAKSKASSADVKAFAEQMIKDHTKANEELEKIAKQKGITVPTELDNEHQSNLDKLSKLSGDAFDAEYVKQQKKGHAKMHELLEDQAKNGEDAELKSFASKTEKVVSTHKTEVEKLGGSAQAS